ERRARDDDTGSRFDSVTRSRANALQLPTPGYQLPTTPSCQRPRALNRELAVGNWEWLAVGSWQLGVGSLHQPSYRWVDAFVGIAKRKRCPSGLTFFHCSGFPGSGPGRLNSSRGVPALNVGVVSTSTAMTSQLRVM